MKWIFKKTKKAESFYCIICKKLKTSKNSASDGNNKICNGCYGELLSKNK